MTVEFDINMSHLSSGCAEIDTLQGGEAEDGEAWAGLKCVLFSASCAQLSLSIRKVASSQAAEELPSIKSDN